LRPAISDVKLRIVGPSGSEPVVRALDEDLPTMIREAGAADGAAATAVTANWQTLTDIVLISPQSTAPADQVRRQAHLPPCEETAGGTRRVGQARIRDCVDEAFKEHLRALRLAVEHRKESGPVQQASAGPPSPPFFIRTVGTDDLLIESLV